MDGTPKEGRSLMESLRRGCALRTCVKRLHSKARCDYFLRFRGFSHQEFPKGGFCEGGNLNNWGGASAQVAIINLVFFVIESYINSEIFTGIDAKLIIATTGARATPIIEIPPPSQNPPFGNPQSANLRARVCAQVLCVQKKKRRLAFVLLSPLRAKGFLCLYFSAILAERYGFSSRSCHMFQRFQFWFLSHLVP